MHTQLLCSTLLPLCCALLTTEVAYAQSEPPETPQGALKTGQTVPTALDSRVDAIEQQLVELKQENQQLKEQVSETQESQSQAANDASASLGKTKIFGFFDTSFVKNTFSQKNSLMGAAVKTVPTFMISGLNVYIGNQLTEKLKFLSELRFTYQPLGSITSRETYYVLPNGTKMDLKTPYTATDTTVTDPQSGSDYRLGGVNVERVQVTYTLSDYLGITVGRFLTPYGIWNVDHGSPVILMTRAPQLQTKQMVPSAQLGLQLFGKVFLTSSLVLDYAATLSNGRGPMDTVADLDDNKAVGLRWRLKYERDDLSIALGQFGYTGKYTASKQTLSIGPGSADYNLVITPTDQYTEYNLANDLRVQLYGLRLQSEYVIHRVSYSVPPPVSAVNFPGSAALASQNYSANYVSRGFYGLLAYEFAEGWLGKGVRLTPFLYYEYMDLNDTTANQANIYSAGLNLRPWPNVALKLEYDFTTLAEKTNVLPDGTRVSVSQGTIKGITAQVAVTF